MNSIMWKLCIGEHKPIWKLLIWSQLNWTSEKPLRLILRTGNGDFIQPMFSPWVLYYEMSCSHVSFFREVKLLQKTLKQLQTESNKRDSKLYANMFARVTKDSSVATKVTGVSLFLSVFNIYIYIFEDKRSEPPFMYFIRLVLNCVLIFSLFML